MDVSVSIQDVLKFYIGTACYDKLQSTLSANPSTEQLWFCVREIREVLLLVSTLLGAFPRKKLEQISRLNRKSLTLENRLHRVEKLGEDFVMLRQWTRSAQDAQWNIHAAASLHARGSPAPGLPALTGDLLLSHKKPFVVVNEVKKCAVEIQRRQRAILHAKFQQLKSEGKIPHRVEYAFLEDSSIRVKSPGEFEFTGIYDGKRWFIVKASLVANDKAGLGFREVLQQAAADDVIQTAFRICARAKIRQWALDASASEGGFVHSVERQPVLKVGVCQGAPFPCYMSATVGDDGDFVVMTEPACALEPRGMTFKTCMEVFIASVRLKVMKGCVSELSKAGIAVYNVGGGELLAIQNEMMFLISLGPRGTPLIKCPLRLGSEVKKSTISSLPQVLVDLSSI